MTVQRVYTGPLPGGLVALPHRQVRFVRGVPCAFRPVETAYLDPAVWDDPTADTPPDPPTSPVDVQPHPEES